MKLEINDAVVDVDVEPDMPLLWILRDVLGLTGTKYGCGIGVCGACTVLVDGIAMRSCQLRTAMLEHKRITTIEGLGSGGALHRVQQAWITHQVPQCGYCQAGQILAAVSLLAANTEPTDEDIDAAMTNLCRCGTYMQIRAAIHSLRAATE
jgi:isoquinoline 1-oxidoreductase subunit alpha